MRCVLPTAEKSAHRWRCEKNCIARLQWAEPSIDRDGRGEKTAGDVKGERGQLEQASVEPKGECDIGNGEAFRPHPPYLVFYVGIEPADRIKRSEEHTSELQSLMRISYAVFCLKKKKNNIYIHNSIIISTTYQTQEYKY